MKKQAVLKFFQRLARGFLQPISIIAMASLLTGITSIFTNEDIIAFLPFLDFAPIQYVANLFSQAGLLILKNLAVVYAICLAFAFAKEDKEFAAFAGMVGYLAFLYSMSLLITSFPGLKEQFPTGGITTVLGFETVNAGILGGMLVGVLVSMIHNKFKNIQLPTGFTFYQGVRFVPILSLLFMFGLGQVFPLVWIYIQKGIMALAETLNSFGMFGPFLSGFIERLLIPTGLHQIWNAIIKTSAVSGTYVFASGAVVEGFTPAYSHFLVEGLPVSPEGITLQEMVKYGWAPQIPIMLGALPAINLAIYKCADPDKRESIKPLVTTGITCAIVAAISEPTEFVFMFAAPALYLVYAVMNGMSWLLCYVLGSTMGASNSSIINLIVSGFLRPDSKWWIMIIVTVIEFVTCYTLFRWWIIRFNVKTPGRGGDFDDSLQLAAEFANVSMPSNQEKCKEEFDITNPEILKAQIIIKGLGEKENIIGVDSCISRLRVTLRDMGKVDENILKKTGCSGIIKADEENIQIVYGTTVGIIKKAVLKEIERQRSAS